MPSYILNDQMQLVALMISIEYQLAKKLFFALVMGIGLASVVIAFEKRAYADEITAGMSCTNAGYMTIDPIYMGRTISGYEQWACASRSGINMKGPPFPVVICGYIGYCKIMGWTY